MTDRIRLLHFVLNGDTSGYFPGLARYHDRHRYAMSFGTLGTIDPALRRVMDDLAIPVLSLGSDRRSAYGVAVVRLARWLRRQRIDILHTHLFDPAVVGLVAGALARSRVRILTRHHSDYHTRIDKVWHVRLDRLCTALSHRVITVSAETARGMLEDEDAPPRKLRVIPNGVDFERMRPPTANEIEELRRELSLHGCVVLSVVARLHREKGQDHLLRAMPRILREAGRPVRLLIAGAGPHVGEYRDLARTLDLGHAVSFLGFRSDAPCILSASDVVVLPSVAESFGLVVVEALSLGRPLVATTAGGIPEIVRDGVDGILVPPASPDALADAVLGLLRDPALAAELGRAGRARAADFSFDAMIRRYEAVYEEALAEDRGSRSLRGAS